MIESARLVPGADMASLRDAIVAAVDDGAASVMLCSATPSDAMAALRRVIEWCPVPVFGGLFPGVLLGDVTVDVGHVVVGMGARAEVAVVRGLSNLEFDAVAAVAAGLSGHGPRGTSFLFISGQAHRIDSVLRAVYDNLGADRRYLGGGCGVLEDPARPSVISPEGIDADALVVASLPQDTVAAVALGWHPVAGPYAVTAAAGTVVQELDFRPAADVFRERFPDVRAVAGTSPPARALGIVSLSGEFVVRDVLEIAASGLTCVGEVPQNSRIVLLEGDVGRLIEAAAAGAATIGDSTQHKLVFDCVSRAGVLGAAAIEELRAIAGAPGSPPPAGAWTVGEIVGGAGRPIAFLNKSLVLVGAAPRPR
jgi:hypothetical protein